MKKIVSLLFIFGMVLSLTGCQSRKNDDDILTFFNAFDHTLEADSCELNGSLNIKTNNNSTMRVKAQLNQKKQIELALQVGLESNGNEANDYLDFYIKDGKTYLKNLDTKSQSVATNIGIKKNSKLSAYNPFLDFSDKELTDFFTTSEKNGNTYSYTINNDSLSKALDSYGTVDINEATLKATIKKNVIRHLELYAKGKQTIDDQTDAFEITIKLNLSKYNKLTTVTFPDDLDSYPVSTTAENGNKDTNQNSQ